MSDNIKVVVKVRPLISREIENKLPSQWRVHNNTLYQLDHNGRDFGQTFTFDKVYNEATKTTDVYNDVAKPIVEAATAGFNGTIFAYGQTASGKTYTMTGTEASPGIIPLSVLNLFNIIKTIPDRDFLVRVSYIEIYNEMIKDLLDVKKEVIKVHETYDGSIKVDVTERVTSSPDEVLEVMREGESNRQTGATNMNEKSSRSHSIFQITIESRVHCEGEEQAGSVNVSQLNLVDLAGSERAGQTGATGIRFKEGTHINKSLSSLALVIKQLSDDPNKYINYRDSKLTRILQNSLGGNAKTSIICAITPTALEETISTLQFATRAKTIKNKPEVNAVATDATMIQSLTKELSKLQSQLESKKNLEVMLENKKHVEQDLQKQIANLQKLILNGFGQRRSIEHIGGTRRKLQLPRRITISAIQSIDEDPAPTIPRFCTPSLKFNSMLIQKPSDFVPIDNSNKLSTVPEEPVRLITPPPNDKVVNFSEDVIQIDSDDDDDDNSTIPTCSPYHKCYSVSKTPPCILRKNLNRAEKNYHDIMELTEREKIYKPDVVELMEKLEESANTTAKLQDELDILRKTSNEKDIEIEHLLCKIKKAEDDAKNAKIELESCRNEYDTKLTDREVSYEILKKKAKLREDELLSLLEEQKIKKSEDIGKLPPTPLENESLAFMEMSKDISLVNSDNESSIITPNAEDSSRQMQDLVASLQDQLIVKGQTILQLEANIESQKQSIEFLEQSSHDLQGMIDSCKEKVIYLENENDQYKTTITTLTETIKSLKESLEKAQMDMSSYTDVIRELQIKLTDKEALLNISASDSVLDHMLANEEKVIANNENMKNIIHSFKIALENRNKEIDQLKSAIQEMNNSHDNTLIEKIKDKTKQIDILNDEISKLKENAQDNITTINNLMLEKTNLATVEQELTKKLAEVEKQNSEYIDNFSKTTQSQLQSLSDKENEYAQLTNDLKMEIAEMSQKIVQIEKEIEKKDHEISTLRIQNQEKQKYECHAKLSLNKLKRVVGILNGDMLDIPELLEDLVILFKSFSDGLSVLENAALDNVSEKNVAIEENKRLKLEIIDLNNKSEMEKTALQIEIEHLKTSLDNHSTDIVNLKQTNEKLSDALSLLQKELDVKSEEYNVLLVNCNSQCKETEKSLRNELQLKEKHISSCNERESTFKSKIDDLELKLQDSEFALKTDRNHLQQKVEILTKTLSTIEELKNELNDKCEEITKIQEMYNYLVQEKDQHTGNVFIKLRDITNKLNIESCIDEEDEDVKYDICHDQVLLLLEKLNNHTTQINELVNESEELKTELSRVKNENKTLSDEIKNKNKDIKILSGDLINTNALLEQIQNDLECKASDIGEMERKAEQYKEQFINLDILMNQQMQDLRHENETIKARYRALINERQIENMNWERERNDYASDLENNFSATIVKTEQSPSVETSSPPTLLTICCNKIVEAIEPKQADYNSTTPSSTDTGIHNVNINSCSTCEELSFELRVLQQNNTALSTVLEQLETANKELINEQENVRREIQLLLEPAEELQKKISSHKTNLSILTATTYAENRSLKSQVKALQHHHNRLHNVCLGDIPELKRQLCELFTVLKTDSSVLETQNVNLKRHSLPDVLDNNSTVSNFKNESTLDGDLLMLDTNVTITTTGDNTLVGYDQTCLDLTQTTFNEVSCQTNDPNVIQRNMSILENDNQNMLTLLNILKDENCKLKATFDKQSAAKVPEFDTKNKSINARERADEFEIYNCHNENNISNDIEIKEEIKRLNKNLSDMIAEKQSLEIKYNNLVLEIPNTDALVSKINSLEKDADIKTNEITKLTSSLNKRNKELKMLQEEYESLSTQIMENISEADDLNKELDKIKGENLRLSEKLVEMQSNSQVNVLVCVKCQLKYDPATSVSKTGSHVKLNRSLSDSETSSRYNKICTLQSELNAGREDCKVLTEDMATIKQHLDCSNMSMDLDVSMGESNVFLQTKDKMTTETQNTSCKMPDIREELSADIYIVDKIDCYNYYLEITGVEKELLSNDVKIIDIMKMFYNNLLTIHGNEVENLVNKLKDYEEYHNKLQTQCDDISSKYCTLAKVLEDKEKHVNSVSKLISEIKCNINRINNELSSAKDSEALTKMEKMFMHKFLDTLDYEFGMSSASVFESLVTKYHDNLKNIEEQCVILQNKTDYLDKELCNANAGLEELKRKNSEKESECNLLKAQKEKMHEISSAVTLDIVRKEIEMRNSLKKGCEKLLELDLISNLDISAIENMDMVIDHIVNQFQHKNYPKVEMEIKNLSLEIKESKRSLNEKERELTELNKQIQALRDENNNVTLNLTDKEEKLCSLKTVHEDLIRAYDNKNQENINNLKEIDKLSEEITNLRNNISNKESIIMALSEKDHRTTELIDSIKDIQEDNEKLKAVNQMIQHEKESYSIDLAKSNETIKQNNVELEKMTADILILRESVKEATAIIESLRQEVQKLSAVNEELKQNFEEKKQDCSRLEINIKTHEKTAEIQSKIILRLQKQKEEDDATIGELRTKIDEITENYNALQVECQQLTNTKESLEARVAELEKVADKPRPSLDAIADSSRRRRQSIHDSKRLLTDLDEHRNLEAMFESRQKPDDLFMDIDGDDNSGRSTPFGLGKGRDSLLFKTDQSDKDEEHPSRPSSVQAARLRRQSIHDMHRGIPRHTPSPHDLSSRINDEYHMKDTSNNRSDSSDVNNLREQLNACHQELEDLKERYRELDDECETCAEYLRERDEQCLRLKKEKAALEKQVSELKSCSANSSQHTPSKQSVAHVAVNTDEDWANLHAVVVDRMSFDAEVDKNKRLTKTVEELRFQKQDLKNTIAKMQKALEKQHSSKDNRELQATKEELKSVREELEELKVRYKELDEECETCAEYLKEREEQCRRLKEAKTALEIKLQELQEDSHTLAHSHSVRKKRQTVHDLNRNPVVDLTDASTATNDDLSLQAERDSSSHTIEDKLREIKRLRMIVEKLTHQKAAMEKQLKVMQEAPAPQPMYVATGSAIVQNQQLTDVMKENQRLKKMNAKLVNICQKRGKNDANRENEDPSVQG